MKRWGLVTFSLFLSACDLFTVRVNGQVTSGGATTSGGTTSRTQTNSAQQTPYAQAYAQKQQARQQAAADKAAAMNAKKSQETTLANAKHETRMLIDALDAGLRKSPDMLAEADLASLEEKRQFFANAGISDAASYLDELSTYYRIENAWRADPIKSGALTALLLGGALTTQGELTDKDKLIGFKFKAEAGKCYTMVAHLKNAGGDDDRAGSFFFDGGPETSSMERYSIAFRRTRGPGSLLPISKTYIHGFCATKPADVILSTVLSYVGSSNSLRYAIIEHARDKFPTYLATEAAAELTDTCDVDNWSLLFTNPIPGGIVYGGTEPFMPFQVDYSEELWMTAWTPGGSEGRIERKDVTGVPPSFQFHKETHFKGCPKTLKDAHSTDGIKVAQCWEALDRRYNPRFDAARQIQANAVGYYAESAAQVQLNALGAQYDAEADRSCGKMNDAIAKKFETAYGKLVDFYQSTPYKSPLDRAARLASTYKGFADIR